MQGNIHGGLDQPVVLLLRGDLRNGIGCLARALLPRYRGCQQAAAVLSLLWWVTGFSCVRLLLLPTRERSAAA